MRDYLARWRAIKKGFSWAIAPTERRSDVRLARERAGDFGNDGFGNILIRDERDVCDASGLCAIPIESSTDWSRPSRNGGFLRFIRRSRGGVIPRIGDGRASLMGGGVSGGPSECRRKSEGGFRRRRIKNPPSLPVGPAGGRGCACRGGSSVLRISRSGCGPGRRPGRSRSAGCPGRDRGARLPPPGSSHRSRS